MSSPGVNWKLILGGALALVGGAIAFHYLTQGKEGEAEGTTAHTTSKIMEEIKALGPVKKEMNGMLNFGYYKDLFMII